MVQTSKDLMCYIINNGLESICYGWYGLLLGDGEVLVELNATRIYREFPFFWRRHTVKVPFDFEYSNDQIRLPVRNHMSGIVSMTGTIDSFEIRNKNHSKWCVRGSCAHDAGAFGMSFSSLTAVRGATICVDTFNMSYIASHF